MTLEEQIELFEMDAKLTWNSKPTVVAEESQQLAEWLKDYKRLLGAIEDIRTEIEKQIERDFAYAKTEEHKVPCHYGTANGLQVALKIINKHTSRKETD